MNGRLDATVPASDELVRENAKLRKIVKVLMDRVERSTDAQGSAFSSFQAAITLESMVRQRTVELQALNRRLSAEVDERRTVERALHAAKSEAERANAGKSEFLAAASHDLMQPLNVARLFVSAIAERPVDAETANMLDRVTQALGSAESLLRTLLEMARLEGGALRAEIGDLAVDPLLHRLADEYGLAAEERGLRLRVVPCGAVVRSDARLLERIVRNLLGNALRYTERGGVLVGARRRGDRLRLEVWDTGIGIAAGDLSEIFAEFRRLDGPKGTDDGAPGMGLGLAIVDRIAPLIGATVDVRSRLGRGSVFAVSLPLTTGSATAPGPELSPAERASERFRGRSILVVDDDGATLDAMRRILREWGLDTIAARGVDDAVRFARGRGERPAVILADYHLLDGATGVDAIDAVRASFAAKIPAIIITSDPDEATRRRVAERGFGYLSKPLRVERLRSLLSHLLAAA